MKYLEKRKNAPRTVQMSEFLGVKSGETALGKNTRELAIRTISHTTNAKNTKATMDGLSPTIQYTGTTKRITTVSKKGKRTMLLAIM
jgi:hypothetical protein